MSKSLSDLMHEAVTLSWDLSFEAVTPEGRYTKWRSVGNAEESDMITSWADGLMHQYYQRYSSGRCSLQAMIDFDVAEFEESVKRDVGVMRALLEQVGRPRQLA
jgi:hypothetical protein